jgi:hypothetical protein
MKNIKYLIVFFLNLVEIKSQIIFPFKNNIFLSSLTEGNFITELFDLNITTNIYIGTPYQKIPLRIKLRLFNLVILSFQSNNNIITYNQNNSKTFKSNDSRPIYYGVPEIGLSRKSNDIIKVNSQILDDINFLLGYDKNKNESGLLGLKPLDSYYQFNLINQLKKKNIIFSRIFYFKFSKNNFNEGELIIGKYPHEFEKKIYDKNNYITSNLIVKKPLEQFYEINIDQIKIGNLSISENQIFSFSLENYFIQIPYIYKQYFENEFVNNTKCKKIENDINRIFYICDKDYDISKLNNIQFYSHSLNYTFIINADELFLKGKDKLIFAIVFMAQLEWSFGYMFLRKYTFVFEQDKKLIGFYKLDDFKSSNSFFLWVVIIIFGSTIIVLISYIHHLLKKKRKLRANELIENYEYLPQK